MVMLVELVDDEEGVGPEVGLSRPAVRSKGAREVVDDRPRRFLPSSEDIRKHVITPLRPRDNMEPDTDDMPTPERHNPTRLTSLAVVLIELLARRVTLLHRCPTGTRRLRHHPSDPCFPHGPSFLEPRVKRSISNWGRSVARPRQPPVLLRCTTEARDGGRFCAGR